MVAIFLSVLGATLHVRCELCASPERRTNRSTHDRASMRLVCSVSRGAIAGMHGLGRIQNRRTPRGRFAGRISRYVPHLYVAGLQLAPSLPRGMAFKQSNRCSISYLISLDCAQQAVMPVIGFLNSGSAQALYAEVSMTTALSTARTLQLSFGGRMVNMIDCRRWQ
jgi:hypothetical protein